MKVSAGGHLHCSPFLPPSMQHCNISCYTLSVAYYVVHCSILQCKSMHCIALIYNAQYDVAVVRKVVQGSDVLTAINANQDDRSGLPGLEVTEIIWQKCNAGMKN